MLVNDDESISTRSSPTHRDDESSGFPPLTIVDASHGLESPKLHVEIPASQCPLEPAMHHSCSAHVGSWRWQCDVCCLCIGGFIPAGSVQGLCPWHGLSSGAWHWDCCTCWQSIAGGARQSFPSKKRKPTAVPRDSRERPRTSRVTAAVGVGIDAEKSADELSEEYVKKLLNGDSIGDVNELMSRSKSSSFALQLVFDMLPQRGLENGRLIRDTLALELHGHVHEAIRSDHGNHLLQKVIQVLPQKHSMFVIDELLGSVIDASQHRYGCRVVCRLLEHHCLASPSKQMLDLVAEILADAQRLCTHEFGHHVISHILQFGSQEHKHKVASTLLSSLSELVLDRRATRIIEDALKYCSSADRSAIIARLSDDKLSSLAEHEFGCYVVIALLDLPDHQARVMAVLRPCTARLEDPIRKKSGGKVMDKLKAIAQQSN